MWRKLKEQIQDESVNSDALVAHLRTVLEEGPNQIRDLQEFIDTNPDAFWYRCYNLMESGLAPRIGELMNQAKSDHEWALASFLQEYMDNVCNKSVKKPNEILQKAIIEHYDIAINIPIYQPPKPAEFKPKPKTEAPPATYYPEVPHAERVNEERWVVGQPMPRMDDFEPAVVHHRDRYVDTMERMPRTRHAEGGHFGIFSRQPNSSEPALLFGGY
jgi:hypothetical protein